MSCSATESPFPSSFLSCPIYLNDKSSWGERERLHPCVQHPVELLPWGHHSSVATQDEYGETWEKCKTTSPVPLQENRADGAGLRPVRWSRSQGGLCQDHFHLLALLERLWEEGSEVMTGPF